MQWFDWADNNDLEWTILSGGRPLVGVLKNATSP
jgi:hypothetical protein